MQPLIFQLENVSSRTLECRIYCQDFLDKFAYPKSFRDSHNKSNSKKAGTQSPKKGTHNRHTYDTCLTIQYNCNLLSSVRGGGGEQHRGVEIHDHIFHLPLVAPLATFICPHSSVSADMISPGSTVTQGLCHFYSSHFCSSWSGKKKKVKFREIMEISIKTKRILKNSHQLCRLYLWIYFVILFLCIFILLLFLLTVELLPTVWCQHFNLCHINI